MGFEFIDSTTPVDPAARQRIRRQAALGKNLGRKLNRPSRKQALRPHPVATRATIDSSNNPDQQEQQEPKAQPSKSDVVEVVEAVRLPAPDNQIGNTLTQLQFKKIGPDSLVMNGKLYQVSKKKAIIADLCSVSHLVRATGASLSGPRYWQGSPCWESTSILSLHVSR